MKKLILLSTFLLSIIHGYSIIRTLNNQSGFSANFTDLPSAIAGSSNGDTLYIQPSSIDYGNATLSKRLFIIGGGHNPDYSPYNSSMTNLIFANGATGSVIKGLKIAYISASSSVIVNDVLISGCYIESSLPFNLSSGITLNNWVFEGNVISSIAAQIELAYSGANWIFRNNFLQAFSTSVFFTSISDGTLFDHNILYQYGANFNTLAASTNGSGVIFRNNIMLTNGSSVSSTLINGAGSSTFQNNLTWGISSSFPDLGVSNITDVNPNFADVSGGYLFNYVSDYNLLSSSQGIDAATDGTDIGLYGGIFNFSQRGFDAGTPRVEDFTLTTPSAPAGGTITIHLKAHGSGQ